jgi:hypothetical protein
VWETEVIVCCGDVCCGEGSRLRGWFRVYWRLREYVEGEGEVQLV